MPAKPNTKLEYAICIPENNRRLDLYEARLSKIIIRKQNFQDPQSIMKLFHGEGGQDQKGKQRMLPYVILLTPLY